MKKSFLIKLKATTNTTFDSNTFNQDILVKRDNAQDAITEALKQFTKSTSIPSKYVSYIHCSELVRFIEIKE